LNNNNISTEKACISLKL